MAAGGGSSSSGDRRVSSAGGLESSVDRKFQAVSNTMESIQGLSSWCIENKKHSAVVVRHWIRSLKRADSAQRLNLFYVANDVIQNCKRKNAMVYRSAFAEVLPGAALLVKDAAVRKAVERIFTIWEERNVYPEELIAELKTGLVKKEAPVPVNPKAALKSKIVAEFTPQTFIDQLAAYKRSVDEVDIKEKQLATMRVDVCSTETLKRLKDKAGGKRFSKDFEDGSAKLEEFVSFLETRVRSGPPLIEALENADVFYEAQYKEVKIVANAYKTFANRVGNLKKKLDLLKSSLPDPEESPVPSPSMDAPSPTGSESPFHDMEEEGAGTTGDVDGVEMDEPFGGVTPRSSSPEPTEDNRDVEDMELSDDEGPAHQHIIVDERREERRDSAVQSGSSPTRPLTGTPARQTPLPGIPLPSLANVDLGKISSILSSLTSVMKSTGASPVSRPSPGTPTTPTSLPGGPKTPVHGPSAPANANPLASILSKVDVTAEGILSALSKTPGQPGPSLQGLSSLLQGVAVGNSQPAPHTTKDRPPSTTTPSSSSSSSSLTPSQLPAPSRSQPGHSFSSPAHEVSSSSAAKSQAAPSSSSSSSRNKQPSSSSAHRGNKPGKDGPPARQQQQEPSTSSPSPSSLELKIHRFLQGNPGFSALNLNIPILGGGGGSAGGEASEANASGPEFLPSQLSENVEGTPVRDERGGTPTQDEMMDKPSSSSVSSSSSSLGVVDPMSLLSKILSPGPSSTPSAPSPLLGRDGYTPNPKLLSNSTSSGQNKTVNKNDDGKLTKSKVAAIGVATTSASNAASISSTTPYSQGARLDLSPTAYRAQAGSWGGQQPSSSSLGGLVDAPPENFYPDNEEGEEEGGYEYGCAEKRPPKVITKGGAGGGGGGGGKHQRRPSSEGGTREYKNKKPSTPSSSSGNRQQKDSGGYNNSNNNNGSFNSRPSPSPSGHGYGYGSGGSEGAPSPSPKASEVFFPPTSDPAGANHSKHFGGLADSSPHSGRHLVSSQSGGGAGTGQPNSFGRGGLGNRGGGGEKPQLSSPTSSSLEFKKINNNNNNNTNNPNSSSSSRKSSDSEFGGHPRDRDFPAKGPEQDEEHYRIETRVSSSDPLPDSTVGKGAPIETLGYNNCRMSGERIQTVESIRVIGKGTLPAGEGGAWYESGEPYMEPPSDLSGVPPLPPSPSSSSSSAPPPPPLMAGLPHQQQQPPPHPGFGNQFEDCLPLQHFQDTPGGPFFGNSHTLLPPIPLLPPPPPGTPRDFGMPPNPPMMRLLDPLMPPQPVPNNQFPPPPQDGAPTPLLPQLLKPPPLMGDHPPHPRPGTVKEYFGGLPGLLPSPTEQHPPNLGRVRESLGGHGHLLPGSPREQCGGLQQGGAPQQRHRLPPPLQQQQHRMDGGMMPLLPPRPKPFQQQRHPHPLQTRPYFRNPRPDFRPREPHFHPREPFRGAKRPRPSFMGVGGGGGPFYAPKRPFLPPRY